MANNDTLIALVTGANTGIGFHLTQQLARTGAACCWDPAIRRAVHTLPAN